MDAPEKCTSNDGFYLDLTQSGAVVTGQFCESYGQDCYAIQGGAFSGSTLTLSYSWEEPNSCSPTCTVNASLTLSADGQTLSGNYHSSNCDCDDAMTIHRI